MTDLTNALRIEPEKAQHTKQIEELLDSCFGPGRFVRAAERLREKNSQVAELCQVAFLEDKLCGAVRYWPILIGESKGLLLGPLAVRRDLRDRGIGLALMQVSLDLAKKQGARWVVLVGDAPYYARADFKQIPQGRVIFPGPVDPARLLVNELIPNAFEDVRGEVTAPRGTIPTTDS